MKNKLKIVRTFFGMRGVTCITAVVAVFSVLVGFVIGVVASDDYKPTSNQLILPEYKSTPYVEYSTHHIYEGETEWTFDSFVAEKECLAKNIYFEAKNQDIQGQIAVGLVTINRVLSPKYPNSICDVVWLKKRNKKGKLVAHFSWTLDGKPDIPKNCPVYRKIYRLADAMIAERSLRNFYDFTNGSDHYHAHYVTPFWSKRLTHTLVVGDHLFYTSSPVAIAD